MTFYFPRHFIILIHSLEIWLVDGFWPAFIFVTLRRCFGRTRKWKSKGWVVSGKHGDDRFKFFVKIILELVQKLKEESKSQRISPATKWFSKLSKCFDLKHPRRSKHDQPSTGLIPFLSAHAFLVRCAAHASNSHLMTHRAIRGGLNLQTREDFSCVFRECHKSFVLIVCGERIELRFIAPRFNSDLFCQSSADDIKNYANHDQTSLKLNDDSSERHHFPRSSKIEIMTWNLTVWRNFPFFQIAGCFSCYCLDERYF